MKRISLPCTIFDHGRHNIAVFVRNEFSSTVETICLFEQKKKSLLSSVFYSNSFCCN